MLASLSSLHSGSGERHLIRLWSRNGEMIGTLENPQNKEITAISFSEDGKQLMATGVDRDRLVIAWNLDRQKLLNLGCQWLNNYLKGKEQNVCF